MDDDAASPNCQIVSCGPDSGSGAGSGSKAEPRQSDRCCIRRCCIQRWEVALLAGTLLALYLPLLGSYSLWDPWETHYAEVARRMLQDHDWVSPKWQDEHFRSKPILTFWLMAASMKLFGVARDGGWSGELVSTHAVEWAVRLPFVLFGIAGVMSLWYMVARIHSRRVAWLAALVTATSPLYFLISRQAITDMPSCALLMVSMSLASVALLTENRPLLRRWGNGCHVFVTVLLVATLAQLVYFCAEVDGPLLRFGKLRASPYLAILPFFVVLGLTVWWMLVSTKTLRQVLFYWFYFVIGLAILAKGPIAPAISGLSIVAYLVVQGWTSRDARSFGARLRQFVGELEIGRGVLIVVLVALPWHVAVFLEDGMPWFREYVGTHLLGRTFVGVHGDRGTFLYYVQQLGVGMWPWAGALPVALAWLTFSNRSSLARLAPQPDVAESWTSCASSSGNLVGSYGSKLGCWAGCWAIVGFTFFSLVSTKFHHYILPVVPALALVFAFWIDDLLAGRIPRAHLLVSLVLLFFTTADLAGAQEKLVHLFVYRYDRPWPKEEPYLVDFTQHLAVFGSLATVAFAGLLSRRLRMPMAAMFGLLAIAFTVFVADVVIVAVAPHWGQRALHAAYYRERRIRGVDIFYAGVAEVVDDWRTEKDLDVPCFVPKTLGVGDPMFVRYEVLNDSGSSGLADDASARQGELTGAVSSIGENRFSIRVLPAERVKLEPLLRQAGLASSRLTAPPGASSATAAASDHSDHSDQAGGLPGLSSGKGMPSTGKSLPFRRRLSVNAERMIAWQLNWRGENFYSGGEVYDHLNEDARTVFVDLDNKKFLAYLNGPGRVGRARRFWIVTEKPRLEKLKGILPTAKATETLRIEDNSCNKYGLASFVLD
ncbi:MAG: glycosyltransferase family 39 protein [Pseudomonadota bacterium]